MQQDNFFDDFFSMASNNPEPVKEEPVVVEISANDIQEETENPEQKVQESTEEPKENVSEDIIKEPEAEAQPKEETSVEPEKPKRRKRRTKEEIEADKLKAAEAVAAASSEEIGDELEDDTGTAIDNDVSAIKTENAKFNPQKLNYTSVMERISSIAIDDKWDEFQKRINEKFDKIQLDTDINPGSLKFTLSMVASLYPELRMARAEVNSDWDTLTNKLTGLIPRQQIMNLNGTSADMRKKKSYEACENYKIDGIRGTINLYDLEATLRKRKEWIQAKEDSLNKIHSCAIGYLTIFKLMENDKQ